MMGGVLETIGMVDVLCLDGVMNNESMGLAKEELDSRCIMLNVALS